jgi:hypothetical protein
MNDTIICSTCSIAYPDDTARTKFKLSTSAGLTRKTKLVVRCFVIYIFQSTLSESSLREILRFAIITSKFTTITIA